VLLDLVHLVHHLVHHLASSLLQQQQQPLILVLPVKLLLLIHVGRHLQHPPLLQLLRRQPQQLQLLRRQVLELQESPASEDLADHPLLADEMHYQNLLLGYPMKYQ